eukprot:2306555-Rhodomonas_salina.1
MQCRACCRAREVGERRAQMKLEAWGGEGRRLARGGLHHKIHYSDNSDQSLRCSPHPSLFP